MKARTQIKIKQTATLKNTLLIGALLLVLSLFILPEAFRELEMCSPGAKRIDRLVPVFPEQIYRLLEAFTERGRQLYVAIELTADLIHTIVSGLFLCFLLLWTYSQIDQHKLSLKLLIFIPLSTIVIGFLENTATAAALYLFPKKFLVLYYIIPLLSLLNIMILATCLLLFGWGFFLYFKENPKLDFVSFIKL